MPAQLLAILAEGEIRFLDVSRVLILGLISIITVTFNQYVQIRAEDCHS